LQDLPVTEQEKLISLGLCERRWIRRLSQPQGLQEHVAAFEQWMSTSKTRSGYLRNREHVQKTLARIRAIVDGCGFDTFADIQPASVETYLGTLHVKGKTYNAYLTAFRHFCSWCVKNGLAAYSPVQYMDRITVRTEEIRRPLSEEEVHRLLAATVKASDRYGMTGLQRAVLYRVAIESGLRRGELASLTVGAFDCARAVIRLEGKAAKDRCKAEQPVTLALAAHMGEYFKDRADDEQAFALGKWARTADMLHEDLAEAGIPARSPGGQEVVFHSFRHTLRTELVRQRVSEAVIDRIMRHKPQGIGKRIYTHVSELEIRAAIERLPEYPWPGELAAEQAAERTA
jgi:site-specific recombinase XerD